MGILSTLASVGGEIAGRFLKGGISDYYNKKSDQREFEMNKALQEDNFAFQREMRDTQYQATVKDMEAAGINPAVALSGGATLSSAQGGSSASVSSNGADTGDFGDLLGSINQTALTQAQLDNINADTAYKDILTGKTKEETNIIRQQKEIDKAISEAEIALKKAQKKEQKAKVIQMLTNVAKEQLNIAYINRYGHTPDAGWTDRAGAKLERIINQSAKQGNIELDSTKLTNMINEFIN